MAYDDDYDEEIEEESDEEVDEQLCFSRRFYFIPNSSIKLIIVWYFFKNCSPLFVSDIV